ncbi:Uncharacterised protein [Mycobacteroides abscessus subsp. abscessus]|nr:Uncharacterised protein [Mycobacteroides abscessus subsp. abscessus]SKV29773.1 Uncharacterised protein [Mycobacteroides abscessus subsp. abscessus]
MCDVQTVDKSQVVIPLGENGYHTQDLAVVDSDGGIRRDIPARPGLKRYAEFGYVM